MKIFNKLLILVFLISSFSISLSAQNNSSNEVASDVKTYHDFRDNVRDFGSQFLQKYLGKNINISIFSEQEKELESFLNGKLREASNDGERMAVYRYWSEVLYTYLENRYSEENKSKEYDFELQKRIFEIYSKASLNGICIYYLHIKKDTKKEINSKYGEWLNKYEVYQENSDIIDKTINMKMKEYSFLAEIENDIEGDYIDLIRQVSEKLIRYPEMNEIFTQNEKEIFKKNLIEDFKNTLKDKVNEYIFAEGYGWLLSNMSIIIQNEKTTVQGKLNILNIISTQNIDYSNRKYITKDNQLKTNFNALKKTIEGLLLDKNIEIKKAAEKAMKELDYISKYYQ